VYFLVLLFVFSYVLKFTRYGRNLYFVGCNASAAHLSGIKVKRTRYLAFIISGLVASFGSLMITSQLSHGRPEMGEGAELEVITIAVLGGVSMNGELRRRGDRPGAHDGHRKRHGAHGPAHLLALRLPRGDPHHRPARRRGEDAAPD
jgi:hypothetical protein